MLLDLLIVCFPFSILFLFSFLSPSRLFLTTIFVLLLQELEAVAKILLPKAGESSGFISDNVERALSAMVQSASATSCLGALVTEGAR